MENCKFEFTESNAAVIIYVQLVTWNTGALVTTVSVGTILAA